MITHVSVVCCKCGNRAMQEYYETENLYFCPECFASSSRRNTINQKLQMWDEMVVQLKVDHKRMTDLGYNACAGSIWDIIARAEALK